MTTTAHQRPDSRPRGLKVAVIGSGVSGLTVALLLHPRHDVTVLEADTRIGGHANTVSIRVGSRTVDVDTGFLVYNERNYPAFVKLLQQLDVVTQKSDMSFSVSDEHSGLEWRGSSLNTVFAQRRRAADPRFLRMLVDVARFNRAARRLLDQVDTAGDGVDPAFTLEDLLARDRYGLELRDWYLVPMGSAIWSADPSTFLQYPAAVFARFFDNHGLLRVRDQPTWRTISGGSKKYVEALTAPFADRILLDTPVTKVVRRATGVEVSTGSGAPMTYDRVVLATHSDQALRLLSDPSPQEQEILGAIRYQPNLATLHTDGSLLPLARRARAAWNYHVLDRSGGEDAPRQATLTYHLNALQGLDLDEDVCVTLNRPDAPDPALVVDHLQYHHPIFDSAAIRAQRRLPEIQGVDGTYFCGAYWRYGFHEDGVQSALDVARHFGAAL